MKVKPPPAQLYGRQRSHPLRPRQLQLLAQTLPRMRFALDMAADPAAAFARKPEALWLEVGFGGGEHTLAQTAANPGIGLIACEVFENGLCSLLTRLAAQGEEASAVLPAMLRLWDGDARVLLAALPDASIDRLFLLFPDPWPKARHAKRRFVHPQTIDLAAAKLRRGAQWRIASDDPTYQGWVTDVFAAQAYFDTPAPTSQRPQGWPPTRYEAKALAAGRQPLYWSATRR